MPPVQQGAESDHTGYEAVRYNAMKHGILSRYTVLSHENHADYERTMAAWLVGHLER
jgi:hypothetical protein